MSLLLHCLLCLMFCSRCSTIKPVPCQNILWDVFNILLWQFWTEWLDIFPLARQLSSHTNGFFSPICYERGPFQKYICPNTLLSFNSLVPWANTGKLIIRFHIGLYANNSSYNCVSFHLALLCRTAIHQSNTFAYCLWRRRPRKSPVDVE